MGKLRSRSIQLLKIIHLCFIAIWFGSAMSWVPLVFLFDIQNFETTRATYLNLRTIAWNVIGWGGIGSFFTGLLMGLLSPWRIFKHGWVTFKLFTVIALILFGMFFLEDLMLINLNLLENEWEMALSNPTFQQNQHAIKIGLIIEFLFFASLIAVSVIKPRLQIRR